jgi:hypothetical protein
VPGLPAVATFCTRDITATLLRAIYNLTFTFWRARISLRRDVHFRNGGTFKPRRPYLIACASLALGMPGSRSMEMRNAWKAAEKLDQTEDRPSRGDRESTIQGTAEVEP